MTRSMVIKCLLVTIFFLLSINIYAQTTIRWEKGAKNSELSFEDGVETKTITVDGLQLAATLVEKKHGILHAYISIFNRGDSPFYFDPSDCFLIVQAGSRTILRVKDPDQLASDLEKRGADALARSTLRGRVATSETTSINATGVAPATITTTRDSHSGRIAVAEGRRQKARLEQAASYVRFQSLRVTTILPGDSENGNIWFDNKSPKESVLSLKVRQITYEFPFEKQKE